jgi:hypothetical protein
MLRPLIAASFFCSLALTAPLAWAAEDEKDDPKARAVSIAEGAFELTAPKDWKRGQPRSNIIEHEFALPGEKKDQEPGRLTIMAAGGSVDANISRWLGQFADRKEEKAEPKEIEVAGQKVLLVDISGTFRDQRGPFAPAVERKDHRMLGAILELGDKRGNVFLKLTGPSATIEHQAKSFKEFVESLKATKE